MKSKPILYIHIGTHKTGSTAIQHILRDQRILLAKKGLHAIYPHLGFEALMRSKTIDPVFARNFKNSIKAQIGKISAQSPARYITSWEGYSGNPETGYRNVKEIAKLLRSATEYLEVKLIIYLRRQDDFEESLYTQMIHEGASSSFSTFSENMKPDAFDWNRLLDAYGAAFGQENLIVRRYGKTFLPESRSLLNNFFEIVGINISSLPALGDKSANRGYSGTALEIARLCNPHLAIKNRKRLRRILQETNAKQPFEKFNLMTSSEREKSYAHYSAQNDRIAKEFFSEEGPLFPPPSLTEQGVPTLTTSTNLETALPLLVKGLMTDGRSHNTRIKSSLIDWIAPKIRLLQRKVPGPMFHLRNILQRAGLI